MTWWDRADEQPKRRESSNDVRHNLVKIHQHRLATCAFDIIPARGRSEATHVSCTVTRRDDLIHQAAGNGSYARDMTDWLAVEARLKAKCTTVKSRRDSDGELVTVSYLWRGVHIRRNEVSQQPCTG